MKQLTYILFAFLVLAMTGCEMHSSDNGDLDNWWYLRQVDDISKGSSEDYIEKKVFWSYIGKIMQTEGGDAGKFFFRFEQKGGTLRIYEPRYNSRGNGDPLLDPSIEADKKKIDRSLPIQGINLKQRSDGSLEETFTIEQLNSDKMVLLNEDKTLRLHFEAW